MFTKEEEAILSRLASVTCNCYCFPLDFNKAKLEFTPTASKLNKFISTSMFFIACAYWVFVVYQLLGSTTGNNENDNDTGGKDRPIDLSIDIFHIIYIFLCSLIAVFHWTTIAYENELITLFNQLIRFNKKAGAAHFGQEYLNESKQTKLLRLLLYLVSSACFCFWSVFLILPNNRYFIYSKFPESLKSIWVHLLVAVLEAIFMLDYVLMVLFFIGLGFIYITTSIFWIKTILSNISMESGTNLENVFQEVDVYNSQRILNKLYNIVYSKTCVPIMLTTHGFGIMVMGFFGIMQLRDRLNIIAYAYLNFATAASFVFVVALFQLMSNMFMLSAQLKRIYSQCYLNGLGGEPKKLLHIRKILKTLRPICCEIQGFGYIKRKTKVTVMNALFDCTVNVLLTF